MIRVRPWRWQVTAALALSATTALVAQSASPAGASPPTTVVAGPGSAVGVPTRYLDQTIAWQDCFAPGTTGLPPGSLRLQCGSFTTPRDWRAANRGPDLTIAVTRLNPAGGRAARSVFTNPGGPGGAGRTLPLLYLQDERTALTDNREIVGIDPRGVGGSTNATCTGATGIGASLDPRDRSRANVDLLLDSASAAARTCQSVDDLSRYITTEQTVRDMDLLRALLKRPTIDYIGYSGGTWMGAAYATYFPDRVGRFVLDGNTEFTARWQTSFAWQPRGFERRFTVDFLPWAATYSKRFGLGTTPRQVRMTYEDLRRQLQRDPIDYLGVVRIDGVLLDSIIAQNLYSKSQFSGLADGLGAIRDLANGSSTAAQVSTRLPALRAVLEDARDSGTLRTPIALDASGAVFYDIQCNDTPDFATRASLIRTSAEQGERFPLLGWSTIFSPCAFWDRTGIPDLAPRTGKGVPPVLMLQNDRDPATPYEGALRARRDFDGARMITVRDEGNHTIYPGNPCVDAKVEAYLLGRAPAADATCLGLGLPKPDAPPSAVTTSPQQRAAELHGLAQTRLVR